MGAATWTMACLLMVTNAGPADPFYINQRNFQIPIGINDPSRRGLIKEVVLSQLDADGRTWKVLGSASPDQGGFTFRAPDDGAYYFRMSIVNAQTGKQEHGETRCIVVDTTRPLLRIVSAERQGDDVVVRWELAEKNPDYATLKLEYLPTDAPGGLGSRVEVAAPQSGQARFHVDGPVAAVRLSVADLAKNESGWVDAPVRGAGAPGTAIAGGAGGLPPLSGDPPTQLPAPVADRGWSPAPPGGTVPTALTKADGNEAEAGGAARPTVVAAAGSDAAPPAPPRPAHGPLPPAQMVRKREITIDYEVTKFGPSGVKSVELYVTRDDGRTWQRGYTEENISPPLPAEGRGTSPVIKRSLTVDLRDDGLYGFYLIVKSGADRGKPPPQNGVDVPQMRVEVDTTFPKAELFGPRPHPTRRDSLVLCWSASDNKLGPTPITLQWAERPDGEWHTIGGGELPNTGDLVGQVPQITGDYVWQVPTNIPAHVYLRMLVRDQAGNESVAQTDQPVLVDLSEPEVKPLQISAGAH